MKSLIGTAAFMALLLVSNVQADARLASIPCARVPGRPTCAFGFPAYTRLIRFIRSFPTEPIRGGRPPWRSTLSSGSWRARARALAGCRFIERGEGVFLLGPTGTGKTHLAKAFAHQACRRMYSVGFYTF